MILTKSASGLLDLSFFTFVLAPIHDFLGFQLVYLFLSDLTLDLALLTALVSMGLVDLGCARLGSCDCSSLVLILGTFVTFCALIHVVEHLVVAHLVLLTSSNFALKNFLELINIVSEEIRHFGHAEGLHICSRSHGLDGELLEIQDVIELLFDLVELDSVPFNVPLFFLLCLFDLSLGPFNKHIEEVWVYVEVLFGHLDDFLDFFILVNYSSEALTKVVNLGSDTLFLLLSDLELAVLLCPQLSLLD